MAGNKTIDGIRIRDIVRVLGQIPGITIRQGINHPFIAMKDGLRSCPIATSTDTRTMIVPWLKQVTGYNNGNELYAKLRAGEWYK